MDAKERARLRALCEDVALPLRAECTLSGHELVDANDEYIGDIETEHSDDDEWCDEAHAALIVGAVNALPSLLDDIDAAERERDEARAEVERLRAAVAAAVVVEREACAVICDVLGDAAEVERDACCDDRSRSLHAGRMHGADECARAIRARGAGGGV